MLTREVKTNNKLLCWWWLGNQKDINTLFVNILCITRGWNKVGVVDRGGWYKVSVRGNNVV